MSDEKKITMKEFRMWLEGVEEMQPEGWIPDARQWARIRDKINSVITDDASSAAPQQMFTVQPRPSPAVQSTQPPPASMMPRAPASVSGPTGPFAGKGTVRTPDVDTSSGSYESSFA